MNYQHIPVLTKSDQEMSLTSVMNQIHTCEGRDIRSHILKFKPVRRCYNKAIAVCSSDEITGSQIQVRTCRSGWDPTPAPGRARARVRPSCSGLYPSRSWNLWGWGQHSLPRDQSFCSPALLGKKLSLYQGVMVLWRMVLESSRSYMGKMTVQ